MGIRELTEVYTDACEDCPETMDQGAVKRMADALHLIRTSSTWNNLLPVERKVILEAMDMYYGDSPYRDGV